MSQARARSEQPRRPPHLGESQISDEPDTSRYLSLREAAAGLPPGRNGRPVHLSTLVRWIIRGSRDPRGEVVRLQAVRMGSRWLTTRPWLDDFARRLASAGEAHQPTPSSGARRRRAERVSRELDREGI